MMPEKWSICDLHQSLTLNSMEMPDTISVFYYSQHALVLAINIPLLAIAFSQEKKPLTTKSIRGHEKCFERLKNATFILVSYN